MKDFIKGWRENIVTVSECVSECAERRIEQCKRTRDSNAITNLFGGFCEAAAVAGVSALQCSSKQRSTDQNFHYQFPWSLWSLELCQAFKHP